MRNRFNVGNGPKTHEQDEFRIGDSVRAHATPIPNPETEWAGFYRVLYSNSPNERTLAISRLVRTAASRRIESGGHILHDNVYSRALIRRLIVA
jgi:hypothetical protein